MRAVAGQEDTPALVVDVIGHQWWWEYRFRAGAAQVNQDAAVTANELHLAVGELVRLDLDSADVQHDFWVPQFGWKRDMYPGKRNVLYATLHDRGTFDGTCSVYCGTQHAWMRIRVVSESPDQFAAWLQVTQSPASRPVTADAQRGEQVFMANTCVNCHTIRGTSASGTVGPDLTHVGSRTTLGAGVLANTPEDMYRWIRNPHAAKPGVLMPAYDSLSESDLRAMAAYLTGLR
jgi:cytochrome c oxidase subunit 2